MNRITSLFRNGAKSEINKLLNIYYTAGFPELDSTMQILHELQSSGVDLVEIGIPCEDPTLDGVTIQSSNSRALLNGMNLDLLFEQLLNMRMTVKVPVLLMGYLSTVTRYGLRNFCKKCLEVGVDGVILPDMCLDSYINQYREVFEEFSILNIFLITPITSDEDVRKIHNLSEGFIYIVSCEGVTGGNLILDEKTISYFQRINKMNLRNPMLIGFGINDNTSFEKASEYAHGAVVGSAFIRVLSVSSDIGRDIKGFVDNIRTRDFQHCNKVSSLVS